ncbi:MAG: hypothetical protein K5787_15155 [Lentisphaeria bacterium]|nr:hypothetical protein [Lentisphaeria bacterium]
MTFFPIVAIQMPSLSDILKSVCTLGFLTGVVCTCLVVLVCWAVWVIRRYRRRNMVFRVMQNDGGELALTYKAVKTHVSLTLEREYPLLTLKGMDFSGASTKSLRLRVMAMEGINLLELRKALCERLLYSFQRELGLGDAIKSINVDVEEFKQGDDNKVASAAKVPAPPIEVPVLEKDAPKPPVEEKHDGE